MSARGGKGDPEGATFTWRGIEFKPLDGHPGMYENDAIDVADDRAAGWRVEGVRTAMGAPARWHARLRIGADRFPGVGQTPAEALEMAAAEAANVATYIVAMLPPASSPPARATRARARVIARKRAIKGGR